MACLATLTDHAPVLAPPSDVAVLAQRIRDGDRTAETELVVRYRAGLTMTLRRRVKDPALAEDLCHEVFQIALTALREGRLRNGAKLAGYLWGIARNLANGERRTQHRERPSPAPELLPDFAPDPDEQLLAAERAALLRRALSGLPPRDRAVLTDFYLTDLSKETVCQRMRLSPGQFDLVKWRALKRLLAAWRVALSVERRRS